MADAGQPRTPADPDPNQAIKAETARLTAEAALLTAEAAKANAERAKALALAGADRAAIDALGLPAFEGKTTLNPGAGAIEALILATEAVNQAAEKIAKRAGEVEHRPKKSYAGAFLLLAGDETINLARPAAIRAEMRSFATVFEDPARQKNPPRTLALSAPAAIAAVTAFAGLLRSETTVSGVDHDAITSRVLATAVAARLPGRAVLPGSAAATPAEGGPLVQALLAIAEERQEAEKRIAGQTGPENDWLRAAIARFDAFFARVTAPDASGIAPIVEASRLEQLLARAPLVLRLHVEKAGGSLINRKNLWTFFGFDPVRVSGGLVASYTISDPATGEVLAADVLEMRTRLGKLKQIQKGP